MTLAARPEKDTKESLLDAAERLFADRGLANTSLRAITRDAGANLAAVNYHFGSKEALIQAVLDRRLGPLNAERLERLRSLEETAAPAPPALREVLQAFVRPAFRFGTPGDAASETFARVLGRLHFEADAGIQELLIGTFRPVTSRFTAVIGRCLPELPADEVLWRFHFMVGAMANTVTNRSLLAAYSNGQCDAADTDAAIEQLVAFLAAGFRGATTGGASSPPSIGDARGGGE